MFEQIITRFDYIAAIILFLIGIDGMLAKKNLAKKLMAMNIMQVAVIIFFIALAQKISATPPIVDHHIILKTANYINPLPHALMLTAIVVSVATTGVALALIITIFQKYKTLEETELLEKI